MRVARTYDRPPVEALMVAGLITKDEAANEVIEIKRSLRDRTADELLAEVRRRLRNGRES